VYQWKDATVIVLIELTREYGTSSQASVEQTAVAGHSSWGGWEPTRDLSKMAEYTTTLPKLLFHIKTGITAYPNLKGFNSGRHEYTT
jgi:hypothetical protein